MDFILNFVLLWQNKDTPSGVSTCRSQACLSGGRVLSASDIGSLCRAQGLNQSQSRKFDFSVSGLEARLRSCFHLLLALTLPDSGR